MHIENLTLINFKNYKQASLKFSQGINCILGLNGSGKTNILDAIYYLSMTKSAHNTIDSQNIKFEESYFSIKGQFEKSNENHTLVCYYQEGTKKSFKVDKKDYAKLSEHIGRFPAVLITPNDTDIIREGSEIRRRFLDAIISQLSQPYLMALIQYNSSLKQRNSALKIFARKGRVDHQLLDTYDQQLIKLGKIISEKREECLNEFVPFFEQYYQYISSGGEKVVIEYQSDFSKQEIEKLVKDSRKKDLITERTNIGIHKDDFKFKIDGRPLKKFGSQGQQKSFSISLKLAHFAVLHAATEVKPVLMLDDIFDKLDSERISKLIAMIKEHKFGQVFITDARTERVKTLMKEQSIDSNYIYVNNGVILKEHEETK